MRQSMNWTFMNAEIFNHKRFMCSDIKDIRTFYVKDVKLDCEPVKQHDWSC